MGKSKKNCKHKSFGYILNGDPTTPYSDHETVGFICLDCNLEVYFPKAWIVTKAFSRELLWF